MPRTRGACCRRRAGCCAIVEPSGEGIRVDAGVVEGQTVTVHYDPLLAKLIAHGVDARARRSRA